MDSTELTFVRCPSCRSLVPAVSARCRMCGATLEASAKPESQNLNKKGRVRQRTMSSPGDELNSVLSALRQGVDPMTAGDEQTQDDQSKPEEIKLEAPPVLKAPTVATEHAKSVEPQELGDDFEEADPLQAYVEEVDLEQNEAPKFEAKKESKPEVKPELKVEVKKEPAKEVAKFSQPQNVKQPAKPVTPALAAVPQAPVKQNNDRVEAPKVVIESGMRSRSKGGLSFGRPKEERVETPSQIKQDEKEQPKAQATAPAKPEAQQEIAKNESKFEPKQELKAEVKVEAKVEQKQEIKLDQKNDHNQQQRQDHRHDHKPDHKTEHKPEHKYEHKQDHRHDQKNDKPHLHDVQKQKSQQDSPQREQRPTDANQHRQAPVEAVKVQAEQKSASFADNKKAAIKIEEHIMDGRLFGWLVDYSDPQGRAIELREGKFFVTRNSLKKSDLILDHASISTPHAVVRVGTDTGLEIQDLMSERGIFVRRRETDVYQKQDDRAKLEHGDWVRFGDVEFIVSLIAYVGQK